MVLGLVLLVASLMTYFQFITPAYDETQQIKSKQLGRSFFLKEEQSTIEKVQGLISSYQTQGQIQNAVSLSLPTNPDIGGALAQIYGISKNSGLVFQSASISSLSIQSVDSGAPLRDGTGESVAVAPSFSLQKPIGSVSFNVRLNGSYEGLKDFLDLLQTNIRIFDVKTLSISPAGASGASIGIFNYDLSVVAYYQETK